jgi:hypothetical protein
MDQPAQSPATTNEGDTNTSPPCEQQYRKYILPLAVFCWPLLYMYTHIFPINGRYTAIGNDFISLYYRYKVYLLAALADFHFPLWAPSEAAGFPFYINPFAQAFYPLNLPLAVWYKISGGYNPLDHQVFTILGLSIFALGLFLWLKTVNNNIRAVIFSVFVMSVSFKVTEIIRFPNAVHAMAWYPWILYCLTGITLDPKSKNAIRYGILLTFSLICLCTAGYPYYIYYCPFLFAPYILALLVRPLRLRLFGNRPAYLKRAFKTLAVVAPVIILTCGPYLMGVKHLMSETTDRGGEDFKYSIRHTFTFEDSLGSLVYPPAARTEGWYFFSITGLLIILLYLAGGRVTGKDNEEKNYPEKSKSKIRSDLWSKLFFIIWICLISYITYGAASYLFIFLWKFVPGFSNLRAWSRLNIVLVPIFAWLLSLAYASFESVISGEKNGEARRPKIFKPIIILVAAYIAILGVQLHLYQNDVYDHQWLANFEYLSPMCIKFIIYGTVAFASILILMILSKKIHFKSTLFLKAVLILLIAVAVLETRPVGMHIWTAREKPQKRRTHLNVVKTNWDSFRFRRTDYGSTIPYTGNSLPLEPIFSVGIIPNWYFNRYTNFLRKTEDEIEARRVLLGVTDGRKVFFSESIEHPTIQSFLNDANRYTPAGSLISYTGDELRWKFNAPVPGYLSFIDNWDHNWHVCVDNKPADMELLFGTFKSVRLPQGLHHVKFYYRPKMLLTTCRAGL